ncbi:MAG: protoporphyrin/coproporphyrin ferrochelatase [Blastocatellia bacterium]|nr:protoporphyrin/coproporphyrin ferrochelatase [Blastocatellia bacterium]
MEARSNYEAILVISFGGPEGMDDVMPFLENVLRGRNVPRERMLQVAQHYELFDGVSPINAQNRELIAALSRELEINGPSLPIYWGNRNWHPLLADTVRLMAADGIRHALAFVTSAYSSYSSCQQYLEDIERARAEAGPNAPRIDKLRAFYNHPGFIEANVANVRNALNQIPEARRAATPIAFTAHSIPLSMANQCEYVAQLREASSLVAESLRQPQWSLVYQSRSGPPTQPWLGPDIADHLKDLRAAGTIDVVIAPIGFVSDHMEIIYDLDTEARALCQNLGLNMIRASTAGTHPAFIGMIRELINERIDPSAPRQFLGTRGVAHDNCAPDCCLASK